MMSFSGAALAVLLLVASSSVVIAGPPGIIDPPPPCCNAYSPRPFPKSHVKSYFIIDDSRCSLPSVVFMFKRGKTGCADPEAGWAKTLMKTLDDARRPSDILSPLAAVP